MDNRAELGRKGQQLAEKFLRRKRYRLRARNYSCAYGEIDLITQHKGTIVFVEVRTQSSDRWGKPIDVLSNAKKERVTRTAKSYMYQYNLTKKPFRFDFIQIINDGSSKPIIEHIEDAF